MIRSLMYVRSRSNPSWVYRIRRLLTSPRMGLVILIADRLLAMHTFNRRKWENRVLDLPILVGWLVLLLPTCQTPSFFLRVLYLIRSIRVGGLKQRSPSSGFLLLSLPPFLLLHAPTIQPPAAPMCRTNTALTLTGLLGSRCRLLLLFLLLYSPPKELLALSLASGKPALFSGQSPSLARQGTTMVLGPLLLLLAVVLSQLLSVLIID